jgi:hypothetical protein
VIMAANDGESKVTIPSAASACRLELVAVSSAVVGLGLALARPRALRGRSAAGRGAGAKKPVVFDGAPDRRRYGGVLVVGKINRRHGLAASQPLSSKTFDPALQGGPIAVRHVHHPDHC